MTITIESWQSAMVFLLTAIAVLSILSTLHWVVFAAPLLKKMLAPTVDGLSAVSRVVRYRYPAEMRDAESAVKSEREMRGIA